MINMDDVTREAVKSVARERLASTFMMHMMASSHFHDVLLEPIKTRVFYDIMEVTRPMKDGASEHFSFMPMPHHIKYD